MSRPRWTHDGGVVRSNLHGLETRKNARIWIWTHESLDMNARKSGERTKVWTWTHESLVNARKSGHERTRVWWTHESLDIGTFRLGRSGHTDFPSGTSTWVCWAHGVHKIRGGGHIWKRLFSFSTYPRINILKTYLLKIACWHFCVRC